MRWVSLVLLVALAGCRSRYPAELVVVVDTDMRPGADFDRVAVAVDTETYGRAVGSEAELPATLTLVRGAPGGAVRVTATASLAGTAVAREQVMTSFAEGTRELAIFLASRCRLPGRPCTTSELCTASACASSAIDPASLPEFMSEHRLDGGPGTDGMDCAPRTEECNSQDDDCDGLVDEPQDIRSLLEDPGSCGRCGNICATGDACIGGFCRGIRQVEAGLHTSCAVTTGMTPTTICQGENAASLELGSVAEMQATPLLHCYRTLDDRVFCRGMPFTTAPMPPEDPVLVPAMNGAVAIAVGRRHVCAIKDAQVYCAGEQNVGQLNGTPVAAPNLIGLQLALQDVTGLSAGNAHTCAVHGAEGRVSCWGEGSCGRLGRGAGALDGVRTVRFDGADLRGIVQVACAGGLQTQTECDASPPHCCALDSGGRVYCWGGNTYGQVVPRVEGGVELEATLVPEAILAPLVRLEASTGTTCGIDRADHVWCWGNNELGLLGTQATGDIGPSEVLPRATVRALSLAMPPPTTLPGAPLSTHALALGWDGRIYCWGDRAGAPCGGGIMPANYQVSEWTPE